MKLNELSATEAAGRVHSGELRSVELVSACLARIEEVEDKVGAWQHIDQEYALEQARKADDVRQAGKDIGPLHGVPVGVKDIVDTNGWPTECGSPILSGRQPHEDACIVSLLREAGAVIMGKTVTTEFAVYSPGKTANPHDVTRTPGGSSSGSAAAVAANMVPLSIGSQTNGSIIRPASYCGVHGFKPTKGSISRHGVLLLSRFLDTMGVYARSIEDIALICECLFCYDERDSDMVLRARPSLSVTAMSEPPVTPKFAFIKSPVWDQADSDTQQGFKELREHLGSDCDEVDLPEVFNDAIDWHRVIMNADLAKNLGRHYAKAKEQLSSRLTDMIEDGQRCLATEYNQGVDAVDVLSAGMDQIFDRYDAIITPAATGEAPVGLGSTGNPIFCTLWTLTGLPAISLPLLQGSSGLPVGVQMVGSRDDDARLLRCARYLEQRVTDDQ